MELIRCEPQPVKFADTPYPGEAMWEYDGEIYQYDSLMASYLTHDVWCNRLDNTGWPDDADVEAVVINFVWYWKRIA